MRNNTGMRKRIVGSGTTQAASEADGPWLDLEHLATVEVASEAPDFPIESALGAASGSGWRAAQPGEQRIRIVFDAPTPVRRIQLRFQETDLERTQQFTLRWFGPSGGAGTEIVRQQWNFNPSGSTTEIENYTLNLDAVSALELDIRPDIGNHNMTATLASWRVA
jgi:hypothetical protein